MARLMAYGFPMFTYISITEIRARMVAQLRYFMLELYLLYVHYNPPDRRLVIRKRIPNASD